MGIVEIENNRKVANNIRLCTKSSRLVINFAFTKPQTFCLTSFYHTLVDDILEEVKETKTFS